MTLQRHTPLKRGKGLKRANTKNKRRKSDIRKLKEQADDACRAWVKEAWDYTCAKCAKSDSRLEWSHVFSRRHHSIRWDPYNAKALCHTCHRWYGGNPWESGPWVERLYGRGRLELLRERKEQPKRWTVTELRALLEHISEDRARIARLREQGQSGFIEPVAFD
jgi:hypothetical protein